MTAFQAAHTPQPTRQADQPLRWAGRRALWAQFVLMAFGALLMGALFAASITVWSPFAWLALFLVVVSAAWIGGGAATALIGTFAPKRVPLDVPAAWRPTQRTAIVLTICGEDPLPVAEFLHGLSASLNAAEMTASTPIVVLSDTQNVASIAAEEHALALLIETGAISYRRRLEPTGRKPGNIAAWVRAQGHAFDHLLVLDADSRMSVPRLRAMIWQMEHRPNLGLLQAGIALVPGRTRFGRHQRLASRLLSPTFLRGFVAWTGQNGNYWGHNALIRMTAFRAALDLPVLPGKAPFGGPLLSHDFVEAAMLRRAGWDVEVEPELAGSAEDAPQTLQAFAKRDRRWCQGNLQHVGVVHAPGLHPLSRVHLGLGMVSYIASPIWLALLALLASGAVQTQGFWPLLPMVLMLLTPKLCALWAWLKSAETPLRRSIILRAFSAELVLSAILAPLVMVRQSVAVFAVLAGQDCGWKVAHKPNRFAKLGWVEAATGVSLGALAILSGGASVLWMAPVVLPLVFAPFIVRLMDAPAQAM